VQSLNYSTGLRLIFNRLICGELYDLIEGRRVKYYELIYLFILVLVYITSIFNIFNIFYNI